MHDSGLTVQLRELLHSRRVASLGTIGKNGEPFVSPLPSSQRVDAYSSENRHPFQCKVGHSFQSKPTTCSTAMLATVTRV
jgi:hypothetical protein